MTSGALGPGADAAPPADANRAPLSRAPVLASAVLLAVLFVLPLVLRTPLLDPDEGLHAAIAQEMVERGDWVTPRLLGTPFLDKPILFFWGLAASIAVLPDNELAVKLPGLFFGALGALATALLAGRLFGRGARLLGGLFAATMLLPMAVTQGAVHDVALVPWTTLAMLALWDAAHANRWGGALARGALAGVWLGLAVLTKALTGVALVGLPFFVWTLLARTLRVRLIAAGVVSLLVAAAIAAPWYLAMESVTPGYLHYYFVERHLLGYATTTQLHGQRAWWYYGPILLGGGLPWIAYVLPTLRQRAGRTLRGGGRGILLAWTWLVVDVAFLSAAGSKLLTYLLPAFPAVALLAAAAWRDALQEDEETGERRPAWRGLHLLATLPLAAAVPVAIVLVGRVVGLSIAPAVWVAAGVASLAWIAAAAVAVVRPRRVALLAVTWSFAVTVAAALVVALPAMAPAFTARELARHYNRAGALPGQILFFDERVGSFLYYLDPPLRAQVTRDRITHVRPDEALGMRHAPADTHVIVPVEELPKLERRIGLSRQPSVLAGHHRVYEAAAFTSAVREAVGER